MLSNIVTSIINLSVITINNAIKWEKVWEIKRFPICTFNDQLDHFAAYVDHCVDGELIGRISPLMEKNVAYREFQPVGRVGGFASQNKQIQRFYK